VARIKTKTTTTRKTAKKRSTRSGGSHPPLTPKAQQALRRAEDAIWSTGLPPHQMLQELHEALLLRCLKDADGNYAAAAARFGPSRQSVQQYANSPLRDGRWRAYQQNRRKKATA
jgi:hypothetical protein